MNKIKDEKIKTSAKKSIVSTKLNVYNINSKTKKLILIPEFLKTKFNPLVFAKAIRIWQLNHLSTTANTKNRSERKGGGKKPWRQKGTGRARVGSSRSPIWKKGGITFGPTPEKSFNLKLNKRERQLVEKMILAKLYNQKQLFVIDKIEIKEPKTKLAIDFLSKISTEIKDLEIENPILIICDKPDKNTKLSIRNITDVRIKSMLNISYMNLAKAQNLVLTEKALNHYIDKFETRNSKSETISKL